MIMKDHTGKGTEVNGLDWTDDFSHENGNYENRCVRCDSTFYGHKRRLVCKKCYESALVKLIGVE